jgi:hypothetical protein
VNNDLIKRTNRFSNKTYISFWNSMIYLYTDCFWLNKFLKFSFVHIVNLKHLYKHHNTVDQILNIAPHYMFKQKQIFSTEKNENSEWVIVV